MKYVATSYNHIHHETIAHMVNLQMNVPFWQTNPLLSSPEAYSFQFHLREGLIEMGGLFDGGGGLFNLEMTMVSVLHKEQEYKVEKLKYKKF